MAKKRSKNIRKPTPAANQVSEPEAATYSPMAGIVSNSPAENKNQRLELRLTKSQKDFINKAASISGFKNMSDYILQIAINDSKSVIREQHILELSERDRASFMETLRKPPEPGKGLKKAKASYLSFTKGK